MSYDPKCYELAQHFIAGNNERLAKDLAEYIQRQIELWLEYEFGRSSRRLFQSK